MLKSLEVRGHAVCNFYVIQQQKNVYRYKCIDYRDIRACVNARLHVDTDVVTEIKTHMAKVNWSIHGKVIYCTVLSTFLQV